MSTMAVSRAAVGRSTLNPDAPLFVPMFYQQVEDFSPEWWELVKTTPWFREHWFYQFQEQEAFGNDQDVADMLLDSSYLGITEFSMLESEFDGEAYHEQVEMEEMISGPERKNVKLDKQLNSDLIKDAKALIRNLSPKAQKNGVRPLLVPGKYRAKPLQCASPKCSPRRIIHQPR